MKNIVVGMFLWCPATLLAQDTLKPAITISGYAEAYYSYDFNKPADHNRPAFLYSHNRSNEFNVNLTYVKAAYAKERVRANIAIGAGTYMNANYAAEPGVLKNLYEANAGYKLSSKKELWLDAGIMSSHVGFESAVSKDCRTLTRSLVAETSPYYNSGARVTYTTDNGHWLFSVLALNGWQRIQRVPGNSLMSWGTQVQYKSGDKLLLNYSTFAGTDKPDSARLWRHFHNFYSILQLSPALDAIVGFDIGQEQKAKGSSAFHTWYAPVAIVRYRPMQQWAVAVRGEYYNDKNGVIITTGTPNGFQTTGFSANIDHTPVSFIALRLEYRWLSGKDNVFIKQQNSTRSNSAVTFSAAVSF